MDSSRSPGGTYFFFGESSSIGRFLVFETRRLTLPEATAELVELLLTLSISFTYFLTESGQPRFSHFLMACLMSDEDFKRSLLAWLSRFQ